MVEKQISIPAQILYDFAERGEFVDPDKLTEFGKNFFELIKIRNIHKRLGMYVDAEGKPQIQKVDEFPQDMLAWAAFLHCFFEQKPLDKDRLKERYGLNNTIYNTLNYIPIMQEYSEMKEKNMRIIDLEDIMLEAIPKIRAYKGIE